MLVQKIFGPKKILGLGKNATTKQHLKVILLSTKGKYMKESNTLSCNATIKQQQEEVLLNTKGQYMKESNTLAGNAGKNALKKGNLARHKREAQSQIPLQAM